MRQDERRRPNLQELNPLNRDYEYPKLHPRDGYAQIALQRPHRCLQIGMSARNKTFSAGNENFHKSPPDIEMVR